VVPGRSFSAGLLDRQRLEQVPGAGAVGELTVHRRHPEDGLVAEPEHRVGRDSFALPVRRPAGEHVTERGRCGAELPGTVAVTLDRTCQPQRLASLARPPVHRLTVEVVEHPRDARVVPPPDVERRLLRPPDLRAGVLAVALRPHGCEASAEVDRLREERRAVSPRRSGLPPDVREVRRRRETRTESGPPSEVGKDPAGLGDRDRGAGRDHSTVAEAVGHRRLGDRGAEHLLPGHR
jgi:hypothetical protein